MSIRNLISIFLLCLIFMCQTPEVFGAKNRDIRDYDTLVKNLETGEQKFKQLKSQRDRLIKNIYKNPDVKNKEKAVKRVLDNFYEESRKLAEKYRKPLVDRLINDVNADLPDYKKIKQSAGTPLYKKDKITGKKVLNPKHRGWEGDTDFGADPLATNRLEKKMKEIGITTEGHASHLDCNRMEITVNNSGNLGSVGSEAHKTQIVVDTNSKETYTSVAMKKKQPGKKRVLIGDHYKKAVNGLKQDPDKLLQNMDDFQGMVKGTLKSIDTANLSDKEIAKIIVDSGYKGGIDDLKNKLEIIKSNPEMAKHILKPDEMEGFQKACKKTLDTSAQKMEKVAQKQIKKSEKKVKSLEHRAKQAGINGDKKTAKKLRQDAQLIREDIVDSKMRIEASKHSIDAKLNKKTFKDISPDYKIVDTPDAPSSKKGIKFDVPAAKFGRGYMKLLDMKGNVEDFKRSVYQAIDEEQDGDSELKTWAKATGYTLAEMSGIPAMKQVYDQVNNKAEQLYKEKIKKIKLSDNPVLRKMQEINMKEYCENLAMMETGATVLMGMIEEASTLAGDTGEFLGELSSDGDEEEIKAQINKAEAKFISYNSRKFKILKDIMADLHENGYDEEKAKKRDELNNYFFQLSISRANDENLSKYTERWVKKIQYDTKRYRLLAEKELLEKELEEQEQEIFFEEVDQETVERNKQVLESKKRQQEYSQKRIAGSQSLNDVGARQAGVQATLQATSKYSQKAYKDMTRAVGAYTEQKNAAFKQELYGEKKADAAPNYEGITYQKKPVNSNQRSKPKTQAQSNWEFNNYNNNKTESAAEKGLTQEIKQIDNTLKQLRNKLKTVLKPKLQSCQKNLGEQRKKVFRGCYNRIASNLLKNSPGFCGGATKPEDCQIGNHGIGICNKEADKSTNALKQEDWVNSAAGLATFKSCVPIAMQGRSIAARIRELESLRKTKYTELGKILREKESNQK